MKNITLFIHTALPWICIGLLLALFFVNQKNNKPKENYGSEGMLLGMSMGCALSLLGIQNTGLDMSMGMLLGLVIGSNIEKKKN